MNNKILIFIATIFLLTGCVTDGAFEPKTTVTLVNTEIFPEFPDIAPLQPLDLIPWAADVPRDPSKVTVKNITKCIKVEENKRDKSFWNRCGENPIVEGSNIYLGMDQVNWNVMVENFAKLKERLQQYEARMKEINKQREKWRIQADERRANDKAIKESAEEK